MLNKIKPKLGAIYGYGTYGLKRLTNMNGQNFITLFLLI